MERMTPTGRTWEYHGDLWVEWRIELTGGLVRIRDRNAKVSPPRTSKSETQQNRKQGQRR